MKKIMSVCISIIMLLSTCLVSFADTQNVQLNSISPKTASSQTLRSLPSINTITASDLNIQMINSSLILKTVYSKVSTTQLTSKPSVISWGTDRLDVFARGINGDLLHSCSNDGGTSWSAWESLGGQILGAPSAVALGVNKISIFVRGTDNHLWFINWNNGWSSWQYFDQMTITESPSVTSWGSSRMDVFMRGTSNQVLHIWYNEGDGWRGVEDLGGIIIGAPAASSVGALGDRQTVECFARGTDSKIWVNSYFNGWSGWYLWKDEVVNSDPSVYSGYMTVRNSLNKHVKASYNYTGSFVNGYITQLNKLSASAFTAFDSAFKTCDPVVITLSRSHDPAIEKYCHINGYDVDYFITDTAKCLRMYSISTPVQIIK